MRLPFSFLDDPLWLYGQNPTGEWLDVMCRRTGERGWVPAACVFDPASVNPISSMTSSSSTTEQLHVSCASLVDQRWYHGAIHRSYAEYLLNSGITGSFLVRESESSFGKLTISLRSDGRIFHYRVCTDENNQVCLNYFPSIDLSVQEMLLSCSAYGLCKETYATPTIIFLSSSRFLLSCNLKPLIVIVTFETKTLIIKPAADLSVLLTNV